MGGEGKREMEGDHNCLDTCATCRVAFSNCNPQFVGLHARMGPTNIGSTWDAYYAIIAMNTMNANTNMNMNIPLYTPFASIHVCCCLFTPLAHYSNLAISNTLKNNSNEWNKRRGALFKYLYAIYG